MMLIHFIFSMIMPQRHLYEKPIVPTIMLTGIISSAISKYLPGPGSHILKQELTFLKPVYHYATIQFLFEITEVS